MKRNKPEEVKNKVEKKEKNKEEEEEEDEFSTGINTYTGDKYNDAKNRRRQR